MELLLKDRLWDSHEVRHLGHSLVWGSTLGGEELGKSHLQLDAGLDGKALALGICLLD